MVAVRVALCMRISCHCPAASAFGGGIMPGLSSECFVPSLAPSRRAQLGCSWSCWPRRNSLPHESGCTSVEGKEEQKMDLHDPKSSLRNITGFLDTKSSPGTQGLCFSLADHSLGIHGLPIAPWASGTTSPGPPSHWPG